MMKRAVLFLMILTMTLCLFSGCKTGQEDFDVEGSVADIETEETEEPEQEEKEEKPEKEEPSKEEEPKEETPEEDTPKEETPKEEEPSEETPKEEEPKEETPEEEPEKEEEPKEEILKGKTALFLGDSVCIGSRDTEKKGGWAGRIAEATGLIATNNGKSGTSISDVRKAKFGTIYDQMMLTTDQDFDYVVLFGGLNDAMDSVEVGQVSNSYLPKDFNTNTFAGGLETLIFYSLHYYGDTASIGYMSSFQTPKYDKGRCSNAEPYFEVAKQICEKWKINYFDMYHHEELNEELCYDTTLYTTDYLHPNPGGYEIITPYVADFMRGMTKPDPEILKKVY